MVRRVLSRHPRPRAFTLIELLVVISIISLLISILMPSLSRARAQAKSVHCLAKLRELGTAIATYENTANGMLPPARWYPSEQDLNMDDPFADIRYRGDRGRHGDAIVEYGWTELLFSYVYRDKVRLPADYPVQRNIDGTRWAEYFICRAVGDEGVSSGHYRVYLPAWSGGSYSLDSNGVWGENTRADPERGGRRDRVRVKLPLIGDANEMSERGDGLNNDDCSYIDAGEANYVGSNRGDNGNRFSDRHYGGANYLFQDLHGSWSPKLREELARDYDLNGVIDIIEVSPYPGR